MLSEAAAMPRGGTVKDKCATCHGRPDEGRSSRAASSSPRPDFQESRYRTSDPASLYWRIELGPTTVEPYAGERIRNAALGTDPSAKPRSGNWLPTCGRGPG